VATLEVKEYNCYLYFRIAKGIFSFLIKGARTYLFLVPSPGNQFMKSTLPNRID